MANATFTPLLCPFDAAEDAASSMGRFSLPEGHDGGDEDGPELKRLLELKRELIIGT